MASSPKELPVFLASRLNACSHLFFHSHVFSHPFRFYPPLAFPVSCFLILFVFILPHPLAPCPVCSPSPCRCCSPLSRLACCSAVSPILPPNDGREWGAGCDLPAKQLRCGATPHTMPAAFEVSPHSTYTLFSQTKGAKCGYLTNFMKLAALWSSLPRYKSEHDDK